MPAKTYIGTSGWNYPDWKDDFYQGVTQAKWLGHYAGIFSTVEVNATFYRLQKPSTLAKWASSTPPGFRFAIKGNRFLTHNRKLLTPLDSIRIERDRALFLGEKLLAVLWQLPAKLGKDVDRLRNFAQALGAWPEVRHCLEPRHSSWFDDEVATILKDHQIAACLSDAASWPMRDRVTTDFVYIRLHGHDRTYVSAYGRQGLEPWAARIKNWLGQGLDVHVYFDNTASGAAPSDARCLIGLLARDS